VLQVNDVMPAVKENEIDGIVTNWGNPLQGFNDEVIIPDAATIAQWREGLRPVTDRYLDDLARSFPNARIAYDKLTRTLAR
jgi:hypothetical protein